MLKTSTVTNNVYAVWCDGEDWIVLAAAASKQEAKDHATPVIADFLKLPPAQVQSRIKIEIERSNGKPVTAPFHGVAVTKEEFLTLGISTD